MVVNLLIGCVPFLALSLPDLPIEFWSDDSINRAASTLGRPLYIDGPTSRKERVSFARCCVEMEVGDDFRDDVIFRYGENGELSVTQPVVYDWRPRQCAKCKVFGLEEGRCIPPRPAARRATSGPPPQRWQHRPQGAPMATVGRDRAPTTTTPLPPRRRERGPRTASKAPQ